MPLTFTAPIEEIPGLLTLQSSDRKSALETTGRFPPPWIREKLVFH